MYIAYQDTRLAHFVTEKKTNKSSTSDASQTDTNVYLKLKF